MFFGPKVAPKIGVVLPRPYTGRASAAAEVERPTQPTLHSELRLERWRDREPSISSRICSVCGMFDFGGFSQNVCELHAVVLAIFFSGFFC